MSLVGSPDADPESEKTVREWGRPTSRGVISDPLAPPRALECESHLGVPECPDPGKGTSYRTPWSLIKGCPGATNS